MPFQRVKVDGTPESSPLKPLVPPQPSLKLPLKNLKKNYSDLRAAVRSYNRNKVNSKFEGYLSVVSNKSLSRNKA